MNKFPYTNFHELNLDWIISKIKNIEVADKKADEIIKYYETVKNDAANINSIAAGSGALLVPSYVGEWVSDYDTVPSSFIKIDNQYYILTFNRKSNNSIVYIANREQNTFAEYKTNVFVQHCNSAAYAPDTENVYIAPLLDFNGSPAYGLLKYDKTLSNYTRIFTSQIFQGVSFDQHTQTLYVYTPSGDIYAVEDDNTLKYVTRARMRNISEYNQDFTVNNGQVFISGYNHYYASFNLETPDFISYGFMERRDHYGKYIFDECEGWEFFDDELLCIEYSKHRNVNSFGFLVKMNYRISEVTENPWITALTGSVFTAYIYTDDAYKFALDEYHFKHPNQLNTCQYKFNTLEIRTTTNYGDVYISDQLVLNNNLVCDNLEARCSSITFNPLSAKNVININTININYRGCKITFAGAAGFVYNIQNIESGNSLSQINIKKDISINGYGFGSLNIVTPTGADMIVLGNRTVLNQPIIKNYTETNISVPANGVYTFTDTIALPYRGNWRALFDYGESDIIGTIGRTINGNNLTIHAYLHNMTSSNVTVNTFRIILLCENS